MKLLPSLLLGLGPVLAVALPLQEGTPGERPPLDRPPVGAEPDRDEARPGRPQGAGALDIFGRTSRGRRSSLEDRLLGCWQMTELSLAGSDENGRAAQGFLTIGESFLTLELHAAWAAGANGTFAEEDIHMSFTAEYVIDAAGMLECTTVIGSYLDEQDGTLQWERAGYRRRYKIQQKTKELILSWADSAGLPSRMKFVPRFPARQSLRDVFGRRRTSPGISQELDLFGRPKGTIGDRDIFGKGQPAEEEKEAGEEGAPPKDAGDRRDG